MFRKVLGAGTLFVFLFSNSVHAITVPNVENAAPIETPAFLRIDIPPDLARVEDIYEAPPKVDPSLIVHVQNAHGNYDAQVKVRRLMKYLYEEYGFRLFFVEGAVDRLNPDYLRIFSNPQHNLEVADAMAREGKLTGAEYFLIDAPEDVAAVGIEHPELYRANLEAFQQVYGLKEATADFLAKMHHRLDQITSRVFSPELRRLVLEWQRFEKGHRDFMPYAQRLAEDARKILNLDLGSLYAQASWPHLSRLLILQEMEKDLDLETGKREKEKVVLELRKLQISPEVVQALQDLEEKKITMNRLEPRDERLHNLPRYLMERLVEEAAPKGFQLTDYPDFALYTAYHILKSEVDSRPLFEEIERLFEKLLDELAATESDRKLLSLLRDHETLRKFFDLEISREEWDRFYARRDFLTPKAFEKRVQAHEEVSRSEPVSPKTVEAFESGLRFYHLARQRDVVFYYRIQQSMLSKSEDKSTLLTGGFHTEGVFDRFRKEEVNYGVLMPRITGDINRETYLKTMLDEHPSMFKTATVEAPALMVSRNELRAMGVDEMRSIEWTLQAAVERNMHWVPRGTDSSQYYTAVDFAAEFNRSPMAALQRAELRLDESQTFAYLFLEGQPVIRDNRYLVIGTTQVNNALGESVRVFGTHTQFIAESPEAKGIQPVDSRTIVLPPDQPEAVTAVFDLPENLEAEALPPVGPVIPSDEILRRQSRAEALRSLMNDPEVQKTLEKEGNLKRYFDLIARLNLSEEFARLTNPADRTLLAARLTALIAVGFASTEAMGEDLSGYFGWVHSLTAETRSAGQNLRALAGTFASDLPGTLVTVSNRGISEEEKEGIRAQLTLNPNLNLFFVLTPPQGAALDSFQNEIAEAEAILRKELSDLGVPNVSRRLVLTTAADNEGSVKRAVRDLYDRGVRRLGAVRGVEDYRSADNLFVVLTAEDTESRYQLGSVIDDFPATLVKSEPLLDKTLHNPERFAAAWLSQRLNAQDKSGDVMGALALKEDTVRSMNQREWHIDREGLGGLAGMIAGIIDTFMAQMRLDVSA